MPPFPTKNQTVALRTLQESSTDPMTAGFIASTVCFQVGSGKNETKEALASWKDEAEGLGKKTNPGPNQSLNQCKP